MSQTLRVPFGERDGELFLPAEVPRGKACGCVCPGCRGLLVANQGSKKQPYFSHYSDADCPGGYESAVHAMAKVVIVETRQLTLPGFDHELVAIANDGKSFCESVAIEPQRVELSSAQAEVSMGNRRVDVIARTPSGADLLIEIRVQHAVDADKQHDLANANLIEIDLSALGEADLTDRTRFANQVLHGTERAWLSCHLFRAEIEAAKARLDQHIAAYNQQLIKKARQELFERQEHHWQPTRARPEQGRAIMLVKARRATYQPLLDKLERMMVLDGGRVRNQELMVQAMAQSDQAEPMYTEPVRDTFFNVEGRYDWAFNVHRTLWQPYLYRKWIASAESGTILSSAPLFKDLADQFGTLYWLKALLALKRRNLAVNNPHQLYQYDGVWFFPNEIKALIPTSEEFISAFLGRLAKYGVLRKSASQPSRFTVMNPDLQHALVERQRLIAEAAEVCPPCHPNQDEEFRLQEVQHILQCRRDRDERINSLLPLVRNYWVAGYKVLNRCDRCCHFQRPGDGTLCLECGNTGMTPVQLDEGYLRSLPSRLRSLPMVMP